MDGVEATKIIRDLGYNHAIVALTANAVSGQADIFLANGFDDFIAKPIDVRQLNTVLNKLVRDKQPPEIIQAARQQAESKGKGRVIETAKQPTLNPLLVEGFLRDAIKFIANLESIIEKNGIYSEEDIRMYVISTHGLKSALANIGKMEISAVALKLEMSGKSEDINVMVAETPAFVELLRAVVEELTPKIDADTEDEDPAYLREKLIEVKTAGEEYNEKITHFLLNELRKKTWSKQTKDLIEAISAHLLHSDFDEIVNVVDIFIKKD
jgi:HPt (histidine-containing phosphotransfer) domain-containing protein